MSDFWSELGSFAKQAATDYIKSDLDNKAASRQIAVITASRPPAAEENVGATVDAAMPTRIDKKWWIVGGIGVAAVALLFFAGRPQAGRAK